MPETNPYSDFDYLRTPTPPPSDDGTAAPGRPRVYITGEPKTGDNPYAQFDRLRGDAPRAEKSPTLRSVALQVPTGFNEATADVLGAPVDATTWVLNRIPGVKIDRPFGGSDSIKRGMAAVGVPNPDDVPAQNTAERIARGTGAGIASMIVPEAAIGTLGKVGAMTPTAVETAGRVFGQSSGPADVAKTAVVGAAAGGTGETAAELSPDQYKPAARLAGNIVGGVGGALAGETPRLAVEAARGARDYVAPMTAAGQEATAGRILTERATSPTDVLDTLNPRPADTGMTVPETPATLQSQIGQLGRERAVVMVPTGTPRPDNIPPGMRGVRTERGIYLYDPTKITQDAILKASRDGTENEILGLGPVSKQEAMRRAQAGETPVAVTERAPDGTELKAAAGTDRTSAAQAASLEAQKAPSSTVSVETPESVVRARQTGPYELVPGSKPTTFQATGDMGLGALEREVQTQNPGDFQQCRADQNAARLDALSTIQPTGNPQDVSAALRRQLGDIDTTTNAAIERATADARAHADGIGGTVPPEQRGSTLRGVLQDAENAARAPEDDLWRAVDPDGRLAISMEPVQAAAEKVYGNLTSAAAAGLTSPERIILQVMSGYKSVEPFRELTDLRSAVSSAMRSELLNVGRSPVYRRLAAFRGGIEDAIGSAVEHQAAQEAHAVARGELAPEQTAAARIRDWQDAWYSRQAEARASDAASAGGNAGSRSAAVPGPRRATGQAGERLRNPASNQGLSTDGGLQPNFDQAARERLTEATTATNERARRYGQGPVGQALRTQGQKANYRSLDASVPDTFFRPGPKGFEAVQALGRAVGDDHAHTLLQDTASASLRQYAMRPDGTLDPLRFASWQQKYQDALRALPGDLSSRFADAANATDSISHVAAIRRDALEAYQRNAIGKLIEARDPEDVVKIVGGVFTGKNPVGSMRQLVTETANDPAARDGLRKAVVDYIIGPGATCPGRNAPTDKHLLRAADCSMIFFWGIDRAQSKNGGPDLLSRPRLHSSCHVPFAFKDAFGGERRVARCGSEVITTGPKAATRPEVSRGRRMSKEPKIEHEYHASKDKLTIKIHRYSLKSKNARSQIIKKLIAAVERLPDRLIADAKKNKKKGASKKLPKSQKVSKLVETGD